MRFFIILILMVHKNYQLRLLKKAPLCFVQTITVLKSYIFIFFFFFFAKNVYFIFLNLIASSFLTVPANRDSNPHPLGCESSTFTRLLAYKTHLCHNLFNEWTKFIKRCNFFDIWQIQAIVIWWGHVCSELTYRCNIKKYLRVLNR